MGMFQEGLQSICLLFRVHLGISSFLKAYSSPDTADDYSGSQGEVTSYTWLPTEIMWANILTWEKKLPESSEDVLVKNIMNLQDVGSQLGTKTIGCIYNQPMYTFCHSF